MSSKKFKIPGEQIRRIIPNLGACVASDQIVVEGKKVGYMYRERREGDGHSGWYFFSGEETESYNEQASNFGVYEVNTIANYDSAIIPYLDAPFCTAFGRVSGEDLFEEEPFSPSED